MGRSGSEAAHFAGYRSPALRPGGAITEWVGQYIPGARRPFSGSIMISGQRIEFLPPDQGSRPSKSMIESVRVGSRSRSSRTDNDGSIAWNTGSSPTGSDADGSNPGCNPANGSSSAPIPPGPLTASSLGSITPASGWNDSGIVPRPVPPTTSGSGGSTNRRRFQSTTSVHDRPTSIERRIRRIHITTRTAQLAWIEVNASNVHEGGIVDGGVSDTTTTITLLVAAARGVPVSRGVVLLFLLLLGLLLFGCCLLFGLAGGRDCLALRRLTTVGLVLLILPLECGDGLWIRDLVTSFVEPATVTTAVVGDHRSLTEVVAGSVRLHGSCCDLEHDVDRLAGGSAAPGRPTGPGLLNIRVDGTEVVGRTSMSGT